MIQKSMKLKILLCLIILISLYSCVQQSEYDKLMEQNEELKEQLDELENGAIRLYGQALEFTKNNELEKAEEKLKVLFNRHGETSECKKGRLLEIQIKSKKNEIVDKTNYENALSTNKLESLEKYISDNPKGKFVNECKKNIILLIKENEQKDYENALTSTNAYDLGQFILKYPNHKSIKNFRKKLIELEVDEIFENRNTGQLPSFEKNSSSYSSYSVIEIENETQCNLIVRYSGTDTKMIDIPAGAIRSISVSSGTYRIAASACGSNYAGTENLQGNYSTKYYITTTRY